MKIESYKYAKSSFLSVEKDFSMIIDKILEGNRIKKLLYYNTKDALEKPNLTQSQVLELIEHNIKIVPKYHIQENLENYIVISFDHFVPSGNPEFRDNLIMFDIVCHVDCWNLQNFQLRPYKIAGEIDSAINNTKLTGIGAIEFAKVTLEAGESATYTIICGATKEAQKEAANK